MKRLFSVLIFAILLASIMAFSVSAQEKQTGFSKLVDMLWDKILAGMTGFASQMFQPEIIAEDEGGIPPNEPSGLAPLSLEIIDEAAPETSKVAAVNPLCDPDTNACGPACNSLFTGPYFGNWIPLPAPWFSGSMTCFDTLSPGLYVGSNLACDTSPTPVLKNNNGQCIIDTSGMMASCPSYDRLGRAVAPPDCMPWIFSNINFADPFFSMPSNFSIGDCQSLNVSGSTYYLTNDVNSSGTCFTILADNVTLDCQSHMINFSQRTFGVGVFDNGFDSATIKNCRIVNGNHSLRDDNNPMASNHLKGILMQNIQNATVTNNTINVTGSNAKTVHIEYSDYNNVSNNVLTFSSRNSSIGNWDGAVVSLWDGDNNTVANNVLVLEGMEGIDNIRLNSHSDYNSFISNRLKSSEGYVSGADNNSYGNVLANTTFYNDFGEALFPGSAVIPVHGDLIVGSDNLEIEHALMHFNSIEVPFLNTSAKIALKGLSFSNPRIMVSFDDNVGESVECPSSVCTGISYYSGEFRFNVAHFTTYIVEETPSPHSGGGGGGRRYVPPNITVCVENWICGNWSECAAGKQVRYCGDTNMCNTTIFKPSLARSCEMPAAVEQPAPAPQESVRTWTLALIVIAILLGLFVVSSFGFVISRKKRTARQIRGLISRANESADAGDKAKALSDYKAISDFFNANRGKMMKGDMKKLHEDAMRLYSRISAK